MDLLSSFGKQGVQLNLLSEKVDIEDVDASSKYFAIIEFPRVFTAGKNAVSFNGSLLLQNKSEILVECVDSNGNSLYLEQARAQDGQFTDASKFVISVHVFAETYNGAAKFILVGTTLKGERVRWVGNLTIDKTLDNSSKVRFTYKPTLEVRPLLYPVVDTERASVDYPPSPAGVQATATANILSNVGSIEITNGGSDYTNASVKVNNSGTGGSGAAASAELVGGKVSRIIVTKPGSGYQTAPKITINGNGKGAAGVALLNSVVSSVSLINGGSGYTFTPSITFTSVAGVGAGAAATATVVDGVVTSIVMTSGGSGYTLVPVVGFQVPAKGPAPEMNIPINFSASFNTLAATPSVDVNRNSINEKQIDIDYRLNIISSPVFPLTEEDFGSQGFPYKSFNSQMENQSMTLHITRVKEPHSTRDIPVNLTASVVVKKVLNSGTVQLTQPFYYTAGSNQFVVNITEGRCFSNYRVVLYNTSNDSAKLFALSPTSSVPVQESYAEITYRNLTCFTGAVARHKLYRKSALYPGDFQLFSEEKLASFELLTDQVTFNKFHDKMGVFYNQAHINKYWFSETPSFTLTASYSPINSLKVLIPSFSSADGRSGIIVKNDTLGGSNDNIYYAYNEGQYNNLSGSSYNSNFVGLKKGVLYVLKTNLSLEKEPSELKAGVQFFFTSSIASITTEKSYDARFGMKIGEIMTGEQVNIKQFRETQELFFTPKNDYYGTLVVVPYHCSPTFSDISLKAYGDHGFSPDIQDIRISFPINVKNEAFDIKAELLDINSNVVYSDLRTVQTFDPNGDSLYGTVATSGGTINTVINVDNTQDGSTTTISGEPYFPDLTSCDTTTRMVGWHIPTGDATDGKLCYTSVSQLYIDNDDYITIHEYQNGVEHIAKSIAVQYNFASNFGRKIFIDESGTKETFP
jgi:hypothetical protein